MNSRILVIALGLLATQVASAQFSDISPWGGSTASAQAQGFGMGNPITLTWSIIPDGTATGSGGQASNLINRFDATFGSGPGGSDLTLRPWFSVLQQSYGRWGQLSGLNMIYEANDDGVSQSNSNKGILGVRGDMRIGGRNIDGSSGVLAFNFFPTHGDMVIDTADMGLFGQSANNFRFLRDTLIHELGHGIGCEHCESNNRSMLMEPFINTAIDGPQLHDIMMAHRGYGDALEKSNGGLGNDTAARANFLGLVTDSNPVSIGDDARSFGVSETATDFVSIDDQSDIDFFSFTIGQESIVDLTLEALGDIYNVGNQGASQSSFDSTRRSNLNLSLFDSTGVNLLGFADASGLGGDEFLQQQLLAGTYLVKIGGVDNSDSNVVDTQFYALGISTEAVPEPATMAILGLAAAAVIRRKRK